MRGNMGLGAWCICDLTLGYEKKKRTRPYPLSSCLDALESAAYVHSERQRGPTRAQHAWNKFGNLVDSATCHIWYPHVLVLFSLDLVHVPPFSCVFVRFGNTKVCYVGT